MSRSTNTLSLFVFTTLFLVAVLSSCSEQPKPAAPPDTSKADEEVIRKLSYQWIDAANQKDVKWFDSVLADEYTMVHSRGTIHNKKQEIDETLADTSRTDLDRLHDLNVRVYGDAAIVTSIEHLKGQTGEIVFDLKYFYTDVYIRKNGRWQVVTTQATRLPEAGTE